MVSTRRSQSAKQRARAYKVGDSVEVLRHEGVAVGTLLHKVPRHASSPASAVGSKDQVGVVDHWMVSIGEIEEDISERMLGRLVSKSDAPTNNNNKKNLNTTGTASSTAVVESDASSSSTTVQQNRRSESNKSDASTNTTVQQNRASSESNKMSKPRVRKNGRFSRSTSPRTSSREVDTTTAAPPAQQQNAAEKKTARKVRKTVAKVQPPLPPPPAAALAAVEHPNNNHQRVHTTRAATRSAGSTVALFRGIEDVVIPPKKQTPKVSASNSKNDGSVVKVQMLTGVLYLYRDGGKRRARFVRTK